MSITCSYHFIFPKTHTSHLLTPPPIIHISLVQSWTIDCSKPGYKLWGCTECLHHMCKQCCIAKPDFSLWAHTYVQLPTRQQGKLPEPFVAPQTDSFPLDPDKLISPWTMVGRYWVNFYVSLKFVDFNPIDVRLHPLTGVLCQSISVCFCLGDPNRQLLLELPLLTPVD